jgi:hypothetical protein
MDDQRISEQGGIQRGQFLFGVNATLSDEFVHLIRV